ncbi:hypothetical protein LCI18_000034 [Fusarium solani-melongenae]|uniref:Uncharacterized protein n=1 Tax=Fusarium solani subsp. cucurbitae TaxID=2747967 RepID=A0ACD3YJL4_FUSSC|nr:hypothetical protein LCI18_000034 [Fusarium solani-melongenae]
MAVIVDVSPEATRNPWDMAQAEWAAGIMPKETSAPTANLQETLSDRQQVAPFPASGGDRWRYLMWSFGMYWKSTWLRLSGNKTIPKYSLHTSVACANHDAVPTPPLWGGYARSRVHLRMYNVKPATLDVEQLSMSQLRSVPWQCLARFEYRVIGVTTSAVVGAASAVVLHYSDICSDGEGYGLVEGQGGIGSSKCFLAADLSTVITLAAIALYCVSTGILYHLQHRKRYVDAFLVCGVALGLVIGFAAGPGPREMLFHLLPGSALAALVLSEIGPEVETGSPSLLTCRHLLSTIHSDAGGPSMYMFRQMCQQLELKILEHGCAEKPVNPVYLECFLYLVVVWLYLVLATRAKTIV